MDETGYKEQEKLFSDVLKELKHRGAAPGMQLMTSPNWALREDFKFWGDGSDLVPDDLWIEE